MKGFVRLYCRFLKLREFEPNIKKSFSLVELTIVVAIVGVMSIMIIAGGFKIPNYSKSIAIINEIATYRQAINTFYVRISEENDDARYLPGDFPNAQYQFAPAGYQTYIKSQISSLSSDIYGTIPLDGDGNGIINATITCYDGVCSSEAFGVWAHLGAYGIISKKYSNVCYSISSNIRTNCLKADYNLPIVSNGEKNAVYTFFKPDLTNNMQKELFGIFSDNTTFANSHILMMSDISYDTIYKSTSVVDSYAFGGGSALSAELMMIIDDKIDDGLPLTGSVLGLNGVGTKGSCHNYEQVGSSFVAVGKYTDKSKIHYHNTSRNACIGAIVFGEFN